MNRTLIAVLVFFAIVQTPQTSYSENLKLCVGDCMVIWKEKHGIKDVHFRFDQFGLEEVARVMLRKNAKILKEYPDLKIEIQGHCDERGSNNYNIALGERRAQSIKMYLMSQGINASRIHTTSYGEEKPFCFEHTEECWFLNRRGHFMIGN